MINSKISLRKRINFGAYYYYLFRTVLILRLEVKLKLLNHVEKVIHNLVKNAGRALT